MKMILKNIGSKMKKVGLVMILLLSKMHDPTYKNQMDFQKNLLSL